MQLIIHVIILLTASLMTNVCIILHISPFRLYCHLSFAALALAAGSTFGDLFLVQPICLSCLPGSLVVEVYFFPVRSRTSTLEHPSSFSSA